MKNKMLKYHNHPFVFTNRTWPNNIIKQAPLWCSVDLRDGNQALINPMTIDKKVKMFETLVEIGFKEIEIGFPSSSKIEFDFLRKIIDEKMIPDDVTIQVLTQAREELIKKTMKSIIGSKRTVVHLYNSTSVNQRKIVFRKSKSEIKQIALNGISWIKKYLTHDHDEIILQYSPESFTGTELEYSLEICQVVLSKWNHFRGEKVILNLPATVELFGPHVYADMIEWFIKNLKQRNKVIISVHTHNDRGTGVAASELAMLAGADRVEGTLFGNGERTGNVDIVTLALNLFMHGVDPNLNLSNLDEIIKVSNHCTEIPVPPRHPYAGELVFTAFSGSHQDAIKKGLDFQKNHLPLEGKEHSWEVPYLSIDPQDIGRNYEAIIRINSQSGKGGVVYVLENEFGLIIPRELQIEFSKVIQNYADQKAQEVTSTELKRLFDETYLKESVDGLKYKFMKPKYQSENDVEIILQVVFDEKIKSLQGKGSGPIDAAKNALEKITSPFNILNYSEHSLSQGSDAQAICYIQIQMNGVKKFGVGIDKNITIASVKALISAVNYFLK